MSDGFTTMSMAIAAKVLMGTTMKARTSPTISSRRDHIPFAGRYMVINLPKIDLFLVYKQSKNEYYLSSRICSRTIWNTERPTEYRQVLYLKDLTKSSDLEYDIQTID